ncbi:MAG: DegT/DnrJ/EryC1/StrS family aminotransferase [Deltaproteobacteria bacterium]|nr:DegT/DnrJ/EryC1/StrS family aminotransferase [Deltaproteobacteria bacterium]
MPAVRLPFDESEASSIAGEIRELLVSGRLAMGEKTLAFEREFARFVGSRHAVAVGSGTQALELICRSLDLSGASVMIPDLTFMATAFAPVAAGAKVILVDVDLETLQMDPGDLEDKMRPDVRAVILVHLGGFISPRHAEIREIARKNGARFLEDAAHAHGSVIDGRPAGSLGDAAAFSFYATKVLPTGEGGMVATSDGELKDLMLKIRQHGQSRPGSNVHESFGLNFRPSEIHSVLGLNVLRRAERLISQRREAASRYDDLLSGSPFKIVHPAPGARPSYYKYPCLLPPEVPRDEFKVLLGRKHSLSLPGEVYATPLHSQPFWKKHGELLNGPRQGFPGSLAASRRQICLPVWPGIAREAQEEVVAALKETIGCF